MNILNNVESLLVCFHIFGVKRPSKPKSPLDSYPDLAYGSKKIKWQHFFQQLKPNVILMFNNKKFYMMLYLFKQKVDVENLIESLRRDCI